MATSGLKCAIEGYVFTEKIGSGSYATVYKAFKKSLRREVVAIKCVDKNSLNKTSTENLLTEIELLKSLNQENIVQLKDFVWDDNTIYLIMEYCSGGDLSAFIQAKRTLHERVVKHFLQQIALALQYMRTKKISHMDLKPQNILLSSSDKPILKIADFGFAQYLPGSTEAVFLRGSPLYMAPEIIIKRFYNEKADLWSVGVILYECLFGKAPFHSKSITELQQKILDDKPIELPYGVVISADCRSLLKGLLQRDPDKRMSYDEFLAHPFVDLEHVPSQHSLDTAKSIITEAVRLDQTGDYKAAIPLYCQSLRHFVSAIRYETDPALKSALRKKVSEYIDRAEELKRAMKPARTKPPSLYYTSMRSKHSPPPHQNRPSSSSSLSRPPSSSPPASLSHLKELWSDHPALLAALKVIQSAEVEEAEEDYEGALHKYELALESLLKILKEQPKSERRSLLQTEVLQWMSQAEAVKNYIKVKDLETVNSSESTDADDDNLTQGCVVQ